MQQLPAVAQTRRSASEKNGVQFFLAAFVLPKVTESCGPLNSDLAPTVLGNKLENERTKQNAERRIITTIATTTSTTTTSANIPHNVDFAPRPQITSGLLHKDLAPTDKLLLTTLPSGQHNLSLSSTAGPPTTSTTTTSTTSTTTTILDISTGPHSVDLVPTGSQTSSSSLLLKYFALTHKL